MPNSMGKPLLFDGCLGNDIALGGVMIIDYAKGLFAIGPAKP
jgi:hypothetical protein